MKITKSQLKQIIEEELEDVLTNEVIDTDTGIDPGAPADLGWSRPRGRDLLDDILERLADPDQIEQVKAALEQSGVLQLDPIEHKRAIKFIMNAHRQHAGQVLDFILVKIADEVLKVNI